MGHDESYYENIIRWEQEKEAERRIAAEEERRRKGLPPPKPGYPLSGLRYTLCDANTPGAIPVYDKLWGRQAISVVPVMYDGKVTEKLLNEACCFQMRRYVADSDKEIKAYLANPSAYEKKLKTDNPAVSYELIKDGHFFGYIVEEKNEFRRTGPYNPKTGKLIYIPIDGRRIETEYTHWHSSVNPDEKGEHFAAVHLEPFSQVRSQEFEKFVSKPRHLLVTACHGAKGEIYPPYDYISGSNPYYSALDGEVEFYGVGMEYDSEKYAELLKEMDKYEIKQTVVYDNSAFQGFTSEISYDEGVRVNMLPFKPINAVVKNGKLAGATVRGQHYIWEGYQNDSREDADSYNHDVFIPICGAPRETEYCNSTTKYGSDGEEDNVNFRVFTELVLKESEK